MREFAPEHLDRFAVALAYPLGFIFVVLARNELYTENTLEPVIPLLHKRDAKTFGNMMRLWGLLILGNLAGGLIFALVIAKTPALQDRMHVELLAIARESTSDSAWLNFYRGIFAGWLLAMLTWVLASTHERLTQVLLIALATIPIAAFDFRHSIVGRV